VLVSLGGEALVMPVDRAEDVWLMSGCTAFRDQLFPGWTGITRELHAIWWFVVLLNERRAGPENSVVATTPLASCR